MLLYAGHVGYRSFYNCVGFVMGAYWYCVLSYLSFLLRLDLSDRMGSTYLMHSTIGCLIAHPLIHNPLLAALSRFECFGMSLLNFRNEYQANPHAWQLR